jgi:hypothetical protein
MTLRPAAARVLALLAGLATTAGAPAACLEFASPPDGAVLARVEMSPGVTAFALTYIHSVTRTPVVERYRVDDATIVQYAIEFEQHGPGLPTQADRDGRFERRDDRFVMTMQRRFEVIVMRVHTDQAPRLDAEGRSIDLATWGNRPLALRARSVACDAA